MKILLIEDSVEDIIFLDEILSEFQLESTPRAPDTITQKYDLIIIDYYTPDGDNLHFLTQLSELTNPPPVLIISNFIEKISINNIPRSLNALLIQKGDNFSETLFYYLDLITSENDNSNEFDYRNILFNLIHDLKNDLGLFTYFDNSEMDDLDGDDLAELRDRAIESGSYAFKRINFLSKFISSSVDTFLTLEEAIEEVVQSPYIKEYRNSIRLKTTKEQFGSLPGYFLVTILKNLLENSCKYKRDDLHLQITVEHFIDDTEEVLIISDNSQGMPTSKAKNLFKKNVKSESGMGYGLYLINSIVTGFGGKIKVSSSQNVGTTVYFQFKKS